MKKFVAAFLTAIMSIACLFAFVACDDKDPDVKPPEELITDIHGRFTYEENGKNKDANGATWEFYIDSGNKFHLFGTLAHSDNTESYIEFEGQVTNIVMSEMYVECAQVMFFTYKYHGVAYSAKDSGASTVTSDYKSAWKEDHGTSDYKIYLVRTTNDTSDDGHAGTFYAESGWDLAEGVWGHVPTTGQVAQ